MKVSKNKKIIYTIIGLAFIGFFLFSIIPVPVKSYTTTPNPNGVWSGFYWTSIGEQIYVGNYNAALPLIGLFIVLSSGVHLWE